MYFTFYYNERSEAVSRLAGSPLLLAITEKKKLPHLQLHRQAVVVEAPDDPVAAAGDHHRVPGGGHLGPALVHAATVHVLEGRQQLLLRPRRGAPDAVRQEPRPERAAIPVAAQGGALLRRLDIVAAGTAFLVQQPRPCRHGRDALGEEVLAGPNCPHPFGAFAPWLVEIPNVDVGVGARRHEVPAVGCQGRRRQDLGASPSCNANTGSKQCSRLSCAA